MKKIGIFILFVFSINAVISQQDAMFTHYMHNTVIVNPAYAGTRDALSFTVLSRAQWVGIEGAPMTQNLTIHSPIPVKNTSVGLSIMNDQIGVTNSLSVYGDFSYKIKVAKNSHLSFGLKAGFDRLTDELGTLNSGSPSDQTFLLDYKSKLLPNFGLGAYFLSKYYYLGASIPRLFTYDYGEDVIENSLQGGKQHYYVIAGGIVDLTENLEFKPTALIKSTMGAPIELDLTATIIMDKRYWAGAMYRTDDAVGLMLGMFVSNQLSVGYSFDWSYANLNQNNGSHEVMISYDFKYNDNKKILSPRYF